MERMAVNGFGERIERIRLVAGAGGRWSVGCGWIEWITVNGFGERIERIRLVARC